MWQRESCIDLQMIFTIARVTYLYPKQPYLYPKMA
jgi:hypothetical protein